MSCSVLRQANRTDKNPDKTDVFTTQIETKQRELEPWTAKISEKQSAIDVATSERDLLVQKASGMQTALEEAVANLERIKEADGSKQEEYAALKKERSKVERALRDAEGKVQVRRTYPGGSWKVITDEAGDGLPCRRAPGQGVKLPSESGRGKIFACCRQVGECGAGESEQAQGAGPDQGFPRELCQRLTP